ncbi:MAG: thiamine-phosphate diphosphorylase [Chloroflexi bacterium RBG_16_68_14]|nr:MAG: thiamine-phosphate diphosphorylase [Chloroflexi bacterium RBG_16_68_14]
MRRWPAPCLMLITDRARLRGRSPEEVASQAVDGGVCAVQLREKDLEGGELYHLAVGLHSVLRGRALFLVNDRVDVALAAGADGVHLPEHGLPGRAVREMVGEACIVGRSVHSVEAAVRAEAEGADFVEVGAVYETASKPGAAPAGVELVRAVAEAVHVPVVAVGGITAEKVAEVVEAGADGIAVIGAILDADDLTVAAERLRRALDEAYELT